jgi:DeoR/GlpR family transcriptional regulator of sugar metabolism
MNVTGRPGALPRRSQNPAAARAGTPFALRAIEGLETKRRIAAAVADMIADGETVVLDSGTTCLEVARTPRSSVAAA